jgi:hypothetical protein
VILIVGMDWVGLITSKSRDHDKVTKSGNAVIPTLACIIREAAEEWFWVGEVAQQMLVAA